MKLNRNKKILIGLMCLGVGFVLYKYFGNVVEGFDLSSLDVITPPSDSTASDTDADTLGSIPQPLAMIDPNTVKSGIATIVVTLSNVIIAFYQGYTTTFVPASGTNSAVQDKFGINHTVEKISDDEKIIIKQAWANIATELKT